MNFPDIFFFASIRFLFQFQLYVSLVNTWNVNPSYQLYFFAQKLYAYDSFSAAYFSPTEISYLAEFDIEVGILNYLNFLRIKMHTDYVILCTQYPPFVSYRQS